MGNKFPVTGTTHILPFEKLSPTDFERLCLWLVEEEGYGRVEHYGAAGSEQGRDVVAYRHVGMTEELWYFQCKRVRTASPSSLKAEIDKVLGLRETDPTLGPHGLVFVTTISLRGPTRDAVRAHAAEKGLECEFWGLTELDQRVKKHENIVREFFKIDAAERVGDAEEKLKKVLPRQLSPPPRDFTGREFEFHQLLTKIQTGVTAIVCLHGAAGVGKTTLALKLAEHLTSAYPDGQICADLKGTFPQPLSIHEVMSYVICSFCPTVHPPSDYQQLKGLYRTILHGKKILLLLDNAANAEQVEPLIPPIGCLLMITSRRRFILPGQYTQDVDIMPFEDARKLLLAIAPRIGHQASQLAKLCGQHPLALRFAGNTLEERQDLNVDEYLVQLSSAKNRLMLVDATLNLSYRLLEPTVQRLFKLLAVFPDTFDLDGAKAVWSLGRESAQLVLSELVTYSFVQWNQTTERYVLHDLVRLFIDARLNGRTRTNAQQRHATHYVKVLASADNFYLQGGESYATALALFDVERANILTGQQWASHQRTRLDTAMILCNEYPNAGAYILNLRLRVQERREWLEVALKASRVLGDRRAEGAHLGNMGIVFNELGYIHQAIDFFCQHLTIVRELDDLQGQGNALGNLGNAYLLNRDTKNAIESFQNRLAIARKIGDPRGEGNAFFGIGLAYLYADDMRTSIIYLKQYLDVMSKLGDRRGEGIALCSLGLTYTRLGDDKQSIEFFKQALRIQRRIGDKRGESHTLGNLGNAHARLGEAKRAIKFYKLALIIDREIGDRRGEGEDLLNMALTLQETGASLDAIQATEQAMVIFREIDDPQILSAHEQTLKWITEHLS